MLKLEGCKYCSIDFSEAINQTDPILEKVLWKTTESLGAGAEEDEATMYVRISDDIVGPETQMLDISFMFGGFWMGQEIDINYCPMCGRKLFKKKEDED